MSRIVSKGVLGIRVYDLLDRDPDLDPMVQVQVMLNHRDPFPLLPGYHGLPGLGASIHALSSS